MKHCAICGKPIAENYAYSKDCYEKVQKGEIDPDSLTEPKKKVRSLGQSRGKETSEKGLYCNCKKQVATFFGKAMLFDSKEEVKIAKIIDENGYYFDHDQEYPYEDNLSGLRYDFRLLRKDGSDFKTRIFIEAKCDKCRDYTDQMLAKQELVYNHGDKFLYSNKNSQEEIEDKLQKLINEIKQGI
jgi:hypothetical protein